MRTELQPKFGASYYFMEDKICVIRQPAGLGDILFSQKIAFKLKEKYKLNVVWPVSEKNLSVRKYLLSPVQFCNINEDFKFKELFNFREIIDNDNVLYIPLQDADQYYPGLCMMDSKYKFVGLKFDDWQRYLNLNRDFKKENSLKKILNINKNEEYVFLNKTYGCLSAPAVCSYLTNFKSSFRVIELKEIEGVSLFDWCTILEGAKEIHTVDTSLMYIIEKLNVSSKLFCYSRYIPASFHDVSHLFTKNWNYVTN